MLLERCHAVCCGALFRHSSAAPLYASYWAIHRSYDSSLDKRIVWHSSSVTWMRFDYVNVNRPRGGFLNSLCQRIQRSETTRTHPWGASPQSGW